MCRSGKDGNGRERVDSRCGVQAPGAARDAGAVHEFHAQCVHQHTQPQSRYIVERYLLIDFKFLKATPGDTARPGGRG